jgi:ABC-type iron transport system FetAB ATPase subunit
LRICLLRQANNNRSERAHPVLRVEHLRIGELPPLSFEVADGGCLAVEAPSGTGKTRLLRAIADLDPAPGHVFLDGAERNEVPPAHWRRAVRYCPAEPAWWTETARAAFPASTDEARIERLLHCLALEKSILDRPIAVLSTGERQRLAMTRALIDEPSVLLLDEPTASLDPQTAALVDELIRYQLLAERSVILVSHDPEQIARLATARLPLPHRIGTPQGAGPE